MFILQPPHPRSVVVAGIGALLSVSVSLDFSARAIVTPQSHLVVEGCSR